MYIFSFIKLRSRFLRMLEMSRFTLENTRDGTPWQARALRKITQPVELLLFSDRYANVPLRAVYVVLAKPAGCTSISLGQHVASSWAR